MQITDIHAHVFPDAIAEKASGSIGEFYRMKVYHSGTVGELLALEKEAGITHACIHSVAVTPRHIESINRFISETVSLHPDSVTGYCDQFAERYGLRHIDPHAFRHTSASILYFAGVDSISISAHLGHAKVSTTIPVPISNTRPHAVPTDKNDHYNNE